MIDIIFLIFIFIFVIGLAYIVTKKLATLGTARMQGKNLKILESTQVGINQHIHLVQVGDQIFTIGVSKEKVSYLCEVDSKSINFELYTRPEKTPSFEEQLKNWIQKRKNNQ